MSGTPEIYLTAKEVAERERVSLDTVKRALKRGHLRGHRVGSRGDWRIAESDYRAWVQQGAKTAPTAKQGATAQDASAGA